MIDVKTIREMIREEATAKFDVGTVVAADVRGDRVVGVRLSGTGVVTRAMTCVEGLQAGDRVLVVHIKRLDRMVAVAQILDEHEGGLSRRGQLSPPANLTYTPIPAGVEVRWDTWPGEDLSWQVRYNSSASDTGATDVLITRGSHYSHWTVDASGDMDTAATTYFRVRAVRWLNDSNIMFSAWSAWSAAQTSGGHNLRELIEMEFEDATELTLDAAGAITRTQVYHTVDTFENAATDNLDTISGGVEGDLLIIKPESGARTVVVRHNQDNIWLLGASNITLDDANDHLMLIYDGSMWCDASGGGGGGGHTTFIAHTDTPAAYGGAANHLVGVDATESWLQWIGVAGWLAISDISDLAWQPDAVAVLHLGRVYEYATANAAINAAVGGDTVLVPPGTWPLAHPSPTVAANASVYGMGPVSECILAYPGVCGGALTLAAGNGEITNITITRTNTYEGAGQVVGLILDEGTTARNVIVDLTNNDTAALAGAMGIQALANSLIINCRATAVSAGGTTCAGLVSEDGTIENSYGYASINQASAFGIGIYIGGATVLWSRGIGTGSAGTRHGIYAWETSYVKHSHAAGDSTDLYVVAEKFMWLYSVEYDTVSGDNFPQLRGDRTGSDLAEIITEVWTFDEAITLRETKLDPSGPGAGYGRLYCRDSAGQTRFYLMDDNGEIWIIAGVANGVTVTVKAAGGDFTTIQDAVDFFKDWIIMGDCVIDVDAGTWTTANVVDFSNLLIQPGATLTLMGDDGHALAGLSYIDGGVCNPGGIANGGTFGVGTECTLATNPGRDQITVSGGGADPDFNADGWAVNDDILVFADNGTVYERVINSISPGGAGNNVIELTVALPAGATLGNDGTAIGLLPDRHIVRSAAGTCVECSAVSGLVIQGFYIKPNAASSGLLMEAGGAVELKNCITWTQGATFGFRVAAFFGYLRADTACSVWECTYNWGAWNGASLRCWDSAAVKYTIGYTSGVGASVDAEESIAGGTGAVYGYYATRQSLLAAYKCGCRQNGAGWAFNGANHIYIFATSTNNRHNVGVPYAGVASCTAFGCDSMIEWN